MNYGSLGPLNFARVLNAWLPLNLQLNICTGIQGALQGKEFPFLETDKLMTRAKHVRKSLKNLLYSEKKTISLLQA